MGKFIGAVLGGAFFIVLGAIAIPVVVLMFIAEIILGIFHVKVKDKDGNDIKSWADNPGYLGIAIALIPLVLLIGYFLVFGVMYIFFLMREYCSSGSPLLIILAVIIPIVGACLMVYHFVCSR